MAITTSGTTLTFNDATTQTTAPVNTNANVTSATAVAGTGISITAVTTTGAATHTVTNTGVTSAVAGRGVAVSGSTGAVTTSLAAGTILQVVSATTTAPFSTSSSSFVAVTGLAVTITPSSSSSKILVTGSISYSGGGGENATIQLQRNSTVIFAGDPQTGRKQGFSMYNGAYYAVSNACNYLDAPATTSALTYQIYMAQNGGATGYVNQTAANRNPYESTTASTITVMEVAG
jgi:hypothetical protein